MNTAAPPAQIDVYLAPQATSDANSVRGGIRIRTGHADLNLRFPAAMPDSDCAAILAQLEATIADRKARYVAELGRTLPMQRDRVVATAHDAEWIG